MPGLKITREVHSEVRAIIAKNRDATNADLARETGLSDKTIRRIRRGGRSYLGYKRQMTADHLKHTSYKVSNGDMPPFEDMPLGKPRVRQQRPSFLKRFRAKRG